jgi:hypothetical protein
LSYCNKAAIPIVAFGAGTSLEGYVLPIFGGISLDLTNLNRILEIYPNATIGGVATTGAAGTTTPFAMGL